MLNIISDARWASLNNYFDSTIDVLEKNIDTLISELKNNQQQIDSININTNLFLFFFSKRVTKFESNN